MSDRDAKAEIGAPGVTCSSCRFSSSLGGDFSVEGGLLVWRGTPVLTPWRGPRIDHCSECGAGFDGVEFGWYQDALGDTDYAVLMATCRNADEVDSDE